MRDEALYGFLRDTANVRFLFDEPIVAYLTELKNKCIEIQALASTFERLPVGEERTALVAQKTERFQWISAQYDLIEARFAPHMSLE